MHGVIKTPVQVGGTLQFSGVNETESSQQPGSGGRDDHSPYAARFFLLTLKAPLPVVVDWEVLCDHTSQVWSGSVVLQDDASAHTNAHGCGQVVPRGCVGPSARSVRALRKHHSPSRSVFQSLHQNRILVGTMKCLYAFFMCSGNIIIWLQTVYEMWMMIVCGGKDILSAVSVQEFS